MTGCRIDNRIGHARALTDLEQQIAVVKFGVSISASGKKCCRGKKIIESCFSIPIFIIVIKASLHSVGSKYTTKIL